MKKDDRHIISGTSYSNITAPTFGNFRAILTAYGANQRETAPFSPLLAGFRSFFATKPIPRLRKPHSRHYPARATFADSGHEYPAKQGEQCSRGGPRRNAYITIRRTKMKILSVVSASLIILSQCAAAEDFEPGGYVAGGPTSVSTSSSFCSFSIGNLSCNRLADNPTSGGTYRVIAGYSLERAFGIEASVASLGTFNVRSSTGALVGSVKATATLLGFRAGRVRPRGYSVFGEFGLASVKTDYSATPSWVLNGTRSQRNTGVYGGVGLQYDANNTFGFRTSLNVIRYSDAEFTSTLATLSVMGVVKF